MATIPTQTGASDAERMPLIPEVNGLGQDESGEIDDPSFEALALIQRVNARLNAVTPTPRSGVQQVA